MRVQRLFYCIVAGIACAAAISLLYGGSGTGAYRVAAEYHDRLQASINNLARTSDQLQRQLKQLQTDPEVVRLYARELGYYAPGESVVHIDDGADYGMLAVDRDAFERSFYSVGTLMREALPVRDGRFKTLPVGFSLGAALFVLVSVIDACWTGRRPGRRAHP